jgi:hypothetical protein
MKKLILILLFATSLFAQTHSWIQLTASEPGTYFSVIGDTVYYVDNSDPSTYSGQIYELYKGLTGSPVYGPYNVDAAFGGAAGYTSCGTWANGSLYNYKDTLFNFNSGTNGYCGYFRRAKVAFGKYSVVNNAGTIYNNNSDYDVFGSQQSTAPVLNDTIFNFAYYYIYGHNNRMFQYKISTGTVSYSPTITRLTDLRFSTWYRYVAADFVISDTLYAITSYKQIEYSANTSDTTATVWKRNPTTFAWDSVRSFNRAGYILNVENDITGNIYFLLAGNDSSQTDCGLWKFDGNTFSKMPRPPSLYRVVGFHIASDSVFWESVANSVVPDSNKLYYYHNTSWDTGQTIYTTLGTQNKNILINNITSIGRTIYVSPKTYPFNFNGITGTGANAIAYDTNYYFVSVLSPTAGYYTLKDSVTVKVAPNSGDSFYVYISYANSYYNLKGQTHGDSLRISLDTLSTNTIVKVVGISHGAIGYSQSFIIVPVKYLKAVSVSISGNTATLSITSHNIGIARIYMNPDTVSIFKYYLGNVNLYDTVLTTQIVSVTLNNYIVNPYFKVTEYYDTTTYDYTPATYISSYSPIPNPGQICYNWAYSGLGATWRRDVSCGWVGIIQIETGVSAFNIDGSGNPVETSLSYTIYVNDPTDFPNPIPPGYTYIATMPTARPWQAAPYPAYSTGDFSVTSASSPVAINGRQFWWSNRILYQKDLINNVTTAIYNNTYSPGATPVFDGSVGVALEGNFLLFGILPNAGYPGVIILKALPYPPNKSYQPLYSIIAPSSSTTVNIYGNYFRGIDPKIKK